MTSDSKATSNFAQRKTVAQVEEGKELAPKFDSHGLIPVVTTDFQSGEVLMHSYMNEDALLRTIESGEAHYWSRSRQRLWHKGATSGLVQKVRQILVDDDQDCIWLRVAVTGGASCHVGYRSCFYRELDLGLSGQRVKEKDSAGQKILLRFTEDEKVFDPEKVYGDAPNPTQL